MKQAFNKIFSLSLAILLLASTTSWSVEKHYCMGHLIDVSFFAEAEDCGMKITNAEVSIEIDEDSCCSDERIVLEGQDDLKFSFEYFNLNQQFFLVAITNFYLHLIEIPSSGFLPVEFYPPPLIVKDIQLLDKVFLI